MNGEKVVQLVADTGGKGGVLPAPGPATTTHNADGSTWIDQELSPESLGWYWRNCRSIGFGLQVWPLDWAIGYERDGDCWGMEWRLHVGPVLFALHANIGDADRRFWPGLDEHTAYDRAEAAWKAAHK